MSTFPRFLIVAEFTTTRHISSEGLTVAPKYLELEDGTGFLELEDGSGLLVLEDSPVTEPTHFEPRLLNSDSLEVELQIEQSLPRDIELEFANADGSFPMSEDYAGKTIKVYHYEILTGTMVLWFTGYVDGVELGPRAVFRCKPNPDAALGTLLPRKCLEASDWATHEDGNPNGTTIKVPETDLGKPYQLPLGNFNKLQLVYAYQNTDGDYYDYLCLGPLEEITTVYRNNRVVASSEWTWNDGTDGKYVDADGRQFAYVRFTRQQKDSNGQQLQITCDGKGLLMGKGAANRNFIDTIKWVLTDPLNGLNQTIDPVSFAESAALSHITPLYCDGVIGRGGAQKSGRQILDDLRYSCFSSLQRKNDGSWKIYTDQPVASSSLTLGACDGVAENLGSVSVERVQASDSIKTLQLAYRYNQWEGTYPLLTSARTVLDVPNAQDEYRELPYVDDPETADRIACYYQLLGQNCQWRADVSGGSDGLELDMLQKITVVDKVIAGGGIVEHVNDDWLVLNYSRRQNSFEAYCRNYDADVFTYTPGTLPDAPVSDDDPDTTYTPPGAPTDLTLDSSGTEQGSDGTTYAYAVLSAVAPTSNCQYLLFGYLVAGQNFVWTKGTYSAGRWSAKCTGMVPGLTYEYYGAQAINPANATDYTDGTVATLAAGVAPGDTTAPSKATNVIAAAGTGRSVQVDWTPSTASDRKESWLYRYTSVNAAAALAAGPVYKGKASSYTDNGVSYGSTYYYWVVEKDNTGNPSTVTTSNFSTVSNGATVSRLQTDDHDDDSITADKISVSTLSAIVAILGSVTVQNAQGITIEGGGNITFALATGKTVVIDCDTSLTKMRISPSSSTGSILALGGTTPWGLINLYANATLMLEVNVGNDMTFTMGAAGLAALGAGINTFRSEGGADLGSSTKYWGDCYICDGWKLTKYPTTNNIQMFYGATQYFDFVPSASGGDTDRGSFWTGDLVYEGSLDHVGWTADFSKVDKREVLQSLVDAYAAHDGTKLHPVLQKKITDTKCRQNEHGIVGVVEEEEKIGKSLDDVVQLTAEVLNEVINKLTKKGLLN